MNTWSRIPVLCAAICLLPTSAVAQQGLPAASGTIGDDSNILNMSNVLQKRWVVAGKVTTLQGDPVAGAKVDVEPTGASGAFRILLTDFQGQFQTDYWLNLELVKEFSVELKVTKKGFLRAHALIDFGKTDKFWLIPVTLREPGEDPKLLSQADLISALGPRLKKLTASDGLSAAAEKDYARGVGSSW